jgi:Sec-independent protein secretion pathway component TatC
MKINELVASKMLVPGWKMHIVGLAAVSMLVSPDGDPRKMLPIFVSLVGLYFAGSALWKWKKKADDD